MPTILTCFPNGEISQGYSYKRIDKRRHPLGAITQCRDEDGVLHISMFGRDDFDRDSPPWQKVGEKFTHECGNTWVLVYYNNFGYTFRVEGDGKPSNTFYISGSILPLFRTKSLVWIGSSPVRILDNPVDRHKKCYSMTRSMSRNIRNACFLLEREVPKCNLSFLTLTLPSLSEPDYLKVLDNWGTIVNRLLKWLDYTLLINKIDFKYVYCSEIQVKRFEETSQLPLHIHCVFQGRKKRYSPWVVGYLRVRAAWTRILADYITDEFDNRALENIQVVKVASGAYLSKYISKGCSHTVDSPIANEIRRTGLRIHWGGMSRILAKLVRMATSRFSSDAVHGELVNNFVVRTKELVSAGLLIFWKEYDIILDSHNSIKIGCGKLSTPTVDGGFTDILEYLYRIKVNSYES